MICLPDDVVANVSRVGSDPGYRRGVTFGFDFHRGSVPLTGETPPFLLRP